MFIDASAIVAILAREAGHEELEKRLMSAADNPLYISPLVKFEASLALARQKAAPTDRLGKPTAALLLQAAQAVDALIEDLGVREMSISPAIGRKAIEAGATYGKIVGHPADLNFGDCFAYACAKEIGVRLLYKGNDFVETDLA